MMNYFLAISGKWWLIFVFLSSSLLPFLTLLFVDVFLSSGHFILPSLFKPVILVIYSLSSEFQLSFGHSYFYYSHFLLEIETLGIGKKRERDQRTYSNFILGYLFFRLPQKTQFSFHKSTNLFSQKYSYFYFSNFWHL